MSVNVNTETFDDDAFPDELRPGTELLHGQYVIEKFLNSGGFGITYLAKDSLDRTVVIKECFPGSFCRRSETIVSVRSRAHQNEFQSIVKLFIQEAKNLAKLKHPNIVGVHQIFEDNETAYMALDYIEGRDLLDIIEDPNDAITPQNIQSITLKLLSALEYIHKEGVLHRDVSPDNILIDRKTGNPVLIDFGAAREEATRQTRMLSAMRVVKDGYSPQEFYIQGSQQSPSSDLYALAATLYHTMTGECPPDSQSRLAAVAAQKLDPYRAFPAEVPGYEPKFLKAINQAMNIFPYDRIQSAAEWGKFITPEPEIVALPTAKKVKPRRPVPVIADEADLAEHSAEAAPDNTMVEPPVPSMVAAPIVEAPPPADPGEDPLNAFRAESSPAKKSSMGLLLGGVAAVILIGAAGAVFMLPEGTLSTASGTPQVEALADATPKLVFETPQAVETDEVVSVTDTPNEAAQAIATTDTVVGGQDAPILAPQSNSSQSAAIGVPQTAETSAPVQPSTPETEVANVAGATTADPNANVPTTEPTVMSELAALPAISLPTPSADDVVTRDAAPTANDVAALPVLDLELAAKLVAAGDAAAVEDAASPADAIATAQQEVVVALATPNVPLTEVPALLGSKVLVTEQTPPVFAVIEAGELTPENLRSILQEQGKFDSLPTVDVASAEPLPEVSLEDEAVSQAMATSAVSSMWTVNVPFSADPTNPNIIGSVRAGAPDWMIPGQTIVAVNGVKVQSIDDIANIVEENVNIDENSVITLQALILQPGDITVEIREITLHSAHSVALENGFQFTTLFSDGEWRTLVTVSPEEGVNALRPGDRLVAYIPTNERLDRQRALSEIFERELINGTSQFAFAVNRSGQLWVASLGYDLNN